MEFFKTFNDSKPRSYAKGQILIYQGEEVEKIHYICSGYIKVYDIAPDGREKLMMLLGEGDIFPLIWSISKSFSSVYFYEVFEDADVCIISRDKFVDLIDSDHTITKQVLRYFINQTSDLMLRIECIEASSAKHKVSRVLEYVATAHGKKLDEDTYIIGLDLTQQTIANMAGITRETTSIQMQELYESGLVSTRRGKMILHMEKVSELNEEE